MKELTIEEKAKAYDKAVKDIMAMMPNWENLSYNGKTFIQDLVHIIPELAESEDEKIRKHLITLFKDEYGKNSNARFAGIKVKDIIAWLEKQSEQKPTEWSEEDENLLKLSIENLTELKDRFGEEYGKVGDCIVLLESIRERVQPKQEWSEEDEQYLLVCRNALAKYQVSDKWDATIISRWLEDKLKSLRPQSQWRPSEEMLEALYRAIPENTMAISEDEMLLDKLYQGLKYGRVLSNK